jgi:tetratricopeptide (TPR) repeat protein
MPFGMKTDGNQKEIDFNLVYRSLIRPAIELAGLDPIRADGEQSAGFIHKPMYERLLFCDFAVADLSFANANVFYELGIRHAIREYTTVCIFEIGTKLPFDVSPLRAFPYLFDKEVQDLPNAVTNLSNLIRTNLTLSQKLEDSPIGQLVKGYKYPDLSGIKNEAIAFNDWAIRAKEKKQAIRSLVRNWNEIIDNKYGGIKSAAANDTELTALQAQLNAIETSLGELMFQDMDVVLTLISAYRGMTAWADLAALIRRLPSELTVKNMYLRQQLAQALGRIGEFKQAEEILLTLIKENGPDPEANGMLGSLYVFEMEKATNKFLRQGFHDRAIDAYLAGFEADPRDFYPGINALTCMFLRNGADESFDKLLPVVEYAVERKCRSGIEQGYWLEASALELALLKQDQATARKRAGLVLGSFPERWMKQSTLENLEKIAAKAFELYGEQAEWMEEIRDAFRS